MPTLNIEGRKVTVGAEFLKLTPDEQNATVDEIAASLKIKSSESPKGLVANAIEPITSYPATQGQMAREGGARMDQGIGQMRSAFQFAGSGVGRNVVADTPANQVAGSFSALDPSTPQAPLTTGEHDAASREALSNLVSGVGNAAVGGLEYATSPINAAYRTLLGKPVENITGIPKEYTEFGAQLATPGLGLTRLPARIPKPITPPVLRPGEEVAAAGERLGVDVPRAVASDTPGIQQISKAVTSVPGVGTPLRQASEAAIADLGSAAQDVRAAYGSGNPATAGAAAREGITESLRSGPIKQRVTELYDRVDDLVNPVITGELPNTRNLVSNIDARRVNAGLPKSSATQDLETALSRQGMNYEGIKDLRTHFGEMMDGNIPIPQGMSAGEVKQVYGALSNDMRLIIAKAGGTEGLRVYQQAENAAKRWAGIREDLSKILKVQSEEAIFDKIAAMAGSKARADINLLGRVRGAVGPQNWDEISAAVIGKMGWPPSGTGFSPDQFLTAYKSMSEEGRRLLFRSTGNASHAEAIDDIAAVAERFKQLNKYANPSGTAQHAAPYVMGAGGLAVAKGLMAGMIIEPMTTVAAVVGGRIFSHILARPLTARTMAGWSKDYEAVALKPTPENENKLEASTKVFAAAIGKDFKRPDLVDELIRRLQGAVPAAAEPEQQQPPRVIGDQP